jgi:hypothetical protein
MGQMEHLLNVYVSRAAKGSCADFLGYCEVSDREATARMTAGVWLVSAPAGPGLRLPQHLWLHGSGGERGLTPPGRRPAPAAVAL